MTSKRPILRVLVLATSVLAISAYAVAVAEPYTTLNMGGVAGLIDMPSGESMPDGLLTASSTHFGPISRTTLSFQISPRLSGSFRYGGTRNWDDVVGSRFETYYDRSFDLRYQVMLEGRYMPAITVGLQDFIGTGLASGEYIAATKNVGNGVKITAGLGWGRLGSYGSLGSPFGSDRPSSLDGDEGGDVNTGQWFKGSMAAFGGVEWQINERWGVKAEYSSDAYVQESEVRETFERRSPFNFGVEYQPNAAVRLGAYYMYGSEIGFAAHFLLDPKTRGTGGITDFAPSPVKMRPPRSADPEAWSPEWVDQPGVAAVLRENLVKRLEDDGIIVEALSFTGSTVDLRIRNVRYDSESQAVGRTARALSQVMPASVETFEIVPVVSGIATSKIVLRRTDIEALEFAPDNGAAIGARALVTNAGPVPDGALYGEDLYPKFTWSILPYTRTSLFDPDNPILGDVGLRFSASYDVAPGLVVQGIVAQKLFGNLDQSDADSTSVLPRVRSDAAKYNKNDGPVIETLTVAWYSRPGQNLYGRVTAGYLERMFGGVSTELLWKRPESPLAVGAELNYARQRDFNVGLGFQDYDVVTGHVSAYYNFGDGYTGQLDVGRYLAGDIGATLSLDREFANGWKVGAFATITDVSAEDFGEGSFDKGIRLSIPVNWITGKPTRQAISSTLRPLTRDGGARLAVEGRLYDTVRHYHDPLLDMQWGRFWR
jgi:Exopolysaccharide biosynthesis protein YbjH